MKFIVSNKTKTSVKTNVLMEQLFDTYPQAFLEILATCTNIIPINNDHIKSSE